MDLESVVTLKDDVDEQLDILSQQKEQVLEHSRRAAALTEELRADRSNMEEVLQALKSSYESALENAHVSLKNQVTASASQISKLEAMLVRQQAMLSSLGAAYAPLVKIRPRKIRSNSSSSRLISALENRRRAFDEEFGGGGLKEQPVESDDSRAVRYAELYMSELEDEVLNLRVHLMTELKLRTQLEADKKAVVGSDEAKKSLGVEVEDMIGFIAATSQLSLEEQDLAMTAVADKDSLVAVLNSLHRKAENEVMRLREKDAMRAKQSDNIAYISNISCNFVVV
jgi:hypothetical protein